MSTKTQKKRIIPTPIPAPIAVPAWQMVRSSPVKPSQDLDVSEIPEIVPNRNNKLIAIITQDSGLNLIINTPLIIEGSNADSIPPKEVMIGVRRAI